MATAKPQLRDTDVLLPVLYLFAAKGPSIHLTLELREH